LKREALCDPAGSKPKSLELLAAILSPDFAAALLVTDAFA
jgi:hypothetical protein